MCSTGLGNCALLSKMFESLEGHEIKTKLRLKKGTIGDRLIYKLISGT
jgi:hypothetical protein